ncbi:hypothetical protein [Paralysiella testudinis]|nr:hypothetical protein [Paralysiella testudinis]QRQ81091.1 hypothetical protein JQU52_10190 [Paralysiella testudinis]
MSVFWSGHPKESAPLEEHLDFLLRLIASDVFYLKIGEGYNDYGVAREFAGRVRYYPLDGTHGILVKTSFFPEVGMDSFRIAEQKAYNGAFEVLPPKW